MNYQIYRNLAFEIQLLAKPEFKYKNDLFI
jgi:hypothetical protein